MHIPHTYEVYQKQLDNFRKTNGRGKPIVLMQYREQYKGFSPADLSLLIEYLQDQDRKWFVADLLGVLESFPEEVLQPMLLAAVNEPDPSFNNAFVKPCRRVFDYLQIQAILLDWFEKGDKARKIGVLRVYYWARPLVYEQLILKFTKGYETQQIRTKGVERIHWNPRSKQYEDGFHFEENLALFNRVYPAQKQFHIQRTLRLIEEFNQSQDMELKYCLALALPKQLDEFPDEIRQEGQDFLRQKHQQAIPQNAIELDNWCKHNLPLE